MKKIFLIEADDIPQYEFELIHRYIRTRLDKMNSRLIIKSVDLNTETERLIFGVHV